MKRWSRRSRIAALLAGGVAVVLAATLMVASACSGSAGCANLAFGAAPSPSPGALARPSPTAAPAARPSPTPTGAQITGLAILGDSTQDEYRTDDNRGNAYAANTYNWVEMLVRLRGVNLGPESSFEEPRRRGYEYNWARSGATTVGMSYWGQHTGAAEQIRAGKVSHVLIQIGINDFVQSDDLGLAIAGGKLSDEQIHSAMDTMAGYIEDAVETLKQDGDAKILLAAVQDYGTLNLSPELIAMNDPAASKRIGDAFGYLNRQVEQVAKRQGVAYFDFNAALGAELAARRDASNFMHIGEQQIDLNRRGDSPNFGFLDDGYMHPGTVLSGLYANVYISAMNQAFGTTLAPLSDAEIMSAAGMGR